MNQATFDRFSMLCDRVGLPAGESCRIWNLLESHYRESHRLYHNLRHIDSMLAHLDSSQSGDDAVELAIWFHDIVYDPRSRDNEAESARLFEECFGRIIDVQLSVDVVRLILATDYSLERTGSSDEDLIRDIDLSILAAEPVDYLAYCSAIRREYLHVPENEFVAGRRGILRRFLAGRIYFTTGFAEFESAARRNIGTELELLGEMSAGPE